VLGLDYLKWCSPFVLATIEHTRAVYLGADLFLLALTEGVYDPLPVRIKEFPSSTMAFLDSVLNQLREHALQNRLRVAGPPLLSLFEAVLVNDTDEAGALVLPIARLVSNPEIISNFATNSYQTRLAIAVIALCKDLLASRRLYRTRMRALSLLAHDSAISHSIIKIPKFMEDLVVPRLADQDASLLGLNWGFFLNLVKYPTVVFELLTSAVTQTVGPKLAQIVSSDNPVILKKFFEFSINLWRTQEPKVVARFCDVMIPMLGRITCIIRTRRVMFKDDERLIKLVEEYLTAILDLDAKGFATDDATKTRSFQETFAKHMNEEFSARSRSDTRKWLK
jgi:hypothetical protein